MTKNIVIFSMSKYVRTPKKEEYTGDGGAFHALCEHTNETPLKYIDWKLKQNGKSIDGVYAFISDDIEKEKTNNGQTHLQRFESTFKDYDFSIERVRLYNNGDIEGSFKSISDMYDVLYKYKKETNDRVIVHVDMTGGLRHGAMLMLALMQMIKFSGIEIGMVLYSNYTTHAIEKANSLMDMFTLIGGADEFTNFGNVNQIQKYFEHQSDLSEDLQNLLKEMRNLSETIKVCGNYDYMIKTLAKLREAIDSYRSSIAVNADNFSSQEAFFAKLLPTIEREYKEIMPVEGEDSSPVEIIKWCAQKGFLQQAITFYCEWLPTYLIEKGLLTVKDNAIQEQCEKYVPDWSNWQNYFLKYYSAAKKQDKEQEETAQVKFNPNKLTYNELRYYLDNGVSIYDVQAKVKGKNGVFDAFLSDAIEFTRSTTYSTFVTKVLNLSEDNILKKILEKSTPDNSSLYRQLQKRIDKLYSADKVIMEAVKQISKTYVIDVFGLADKDMALPDTTDKRTEKDEHKVAAILKKREKVFRDLFDAKKITSALPEDVMMKFILEYNKYVMQWRNHINHANSISADEESNSGIAKAIIDSVSLLEQK